MSHVWKMLSSRKVLLKKFLNFRFKVLGFPLFCVFPTMLYFDACHNLFFIKKKKVLALEVGLLYWRNLERKFYSVRTNGDVKASLMKSRFYCKCIVKRKISKLL